MIGGSIESISIDSRSFPVPSDTDITTMIGGFKNETLPNGNGTARTKKERVPWKLSGVVLGISHADGDPVFLQNIANRENVPVVITFADDSTLNGTGSIEGDLTFSSADSTASLELAGSGTLSQ